MAVVLDTDTLPVRERPEAVRAAMRYARVPAELTHDPNAEQIQARVESWELGSGVSLVHRRGTGITLARTPRQVRQDAEGRVSLTLLGPGRWRFLQGAVEQVIDDRQWRACLVDQASAYRFQRVGASQMFAIGLDPDLLGMSADALRRAAHGVKRSPLLEMLVRHVIDVAHVADTVAPGPATTMLGSATAELVRAVLAVATDPAAPPPAAETPELLVTTRMFVDRHVTDTELTPGRIARAHHVSLRRLYTAWSANEVSLATYITTQRLELARRALVHDVPPVPTIAAVARRCGFVDATHFSRRFREAYGMSPREWRQSRHTGSGR